MADWPTLRDIIQCDGCGTQWIEEKMYTFRCAKCHCWSGVTLDSLEHDPPPVIKPTVADMMDRKLPDV